METYRDYLLERMKPFSVRAHLSTIRAHYRKLMRQNGFIQMLYMMIERDRPELGPADRKAKVDEFLRQLSNEIDPTNAPVKLVIKQDEADDDHLRLTVTQANILLTMPGTKTLHGSRDTAMITLMLCTGIREAELCNLDVDDLRQRFGGKLALKIRKGKRCKQRMIPFGDMDWVLVLVDAWMVAAGIV